MPGAPQRNHLVPLTPFSIQATGITGWQYWKGLPRHHGTSAWWSSLFALRLRKGTATMLNDGQLAPARGYGWATTTPTAWGSAVPPGRRTRFWFSCPGARSTCREAPISPLLPSRSTALPKRLRISKGRRSGSVRPAPAMGQENTSEAELTGGVIPA
jgi:hypothetical protein